MNWTAMSDVGDLRSRLNNLRGRIQNVGDPSKPTLEGRLHAVRQRIREHAESFDDSSGYLTQSDEWAARPHHDSLSDGSNAELQEKLADQFALLNALACEPAF